jgi:C_GCAxxG_C_C family probable redox protein
MLDILKNELDVVTHLNKKLTAKVHMGIISPNEWDTHMFEYFQKAAYSLRRTREILLFEEKIEDLTEGTINQMRQHVEIVTVGESIFERLHCSEAFVSTVGSYLFGSVDDRLLRAATGFAGGVGGTHEGMCGALVGGVLCIGAMYGRAQMNEDDQIAYRLSAAYREAFINEFDVVQCKDLREKGFGAGGHTLCGVLVGRAIRIFFDVLKEKAEILKEGQ